VLAECRIPVQKTLLRFSSEVYDPNSVDSGSMAERSSLSHNSIGPLILQVFFFIFNFRVPE